MMCMYEYINMYIYIYKYINYILYMWVYRRSCLVQLHYTETYSCIVDHSACPYLFYISIKKTTVSHI